MKLIKRIISGLVSISMLLSVPLISLADNNLGGNTQSGGGTGVASDAAYAHKFLMYPENMGYRISIVDKYGERVSSSVDVVNYAVNDIVSMGYGNSMAGGGLAEIQEGYQQYINWLGWKDYSDKGWSKKNRIFYSNGIKTEEFSRRTWNQYGVPNGENKDGETIHTNMYPKVKFEEYLKLNYNLAVAELQKKDASLKQVDSIKIPLPSILNESKTHFSAGGLELIQIMQSPVGRYKQENTDNEENLISLMVNMQVPQHNNSGESIGKIDYLFKFSDTKEQERRGKEEIDKVTGEKKITSAADIIAENGYKVIFEPLYWYVPELLSIHPDMLSVTKEGGAHYGWIPGVCYGTVSYMARYVYDTFNDILTDEHYKLSWTGSDWGGGKLGVTTLMIAYTDTDLKINEPSSATVPPTEVPGTGQFSLYSLASGDLYKTSGYSLHIYDNILGVKKSGTPTWDKDTFPENNYKCGPSPKNTNDDGSYPQNYASEGESYRTSNKDHKFNIVKFYAEKQPDGSYVYKENYTREQAIHDIQIDDEIGYKVDNYYTSDKFEKPTNPTDDYDVWKTSKAPKATYEGTKAEHIQIKATDKDTTLYIRLISTPKLVIVKYFPTGEKTVEEIPWVPSYDTNEDGYVYEEDKQSPDKPDDIPNDYEETNGTSENNPIIPVKTDTRIIYIKYKQPEADSKITLHQNELAHGFTLEDIQALVKLTHSFDSREHSGSGTHGSGSDTWHCSWHRVIDDGDYSYIISNKEDYSLTSFVGSQGAFQSKEIGNNNDSGSLGIGGGSTNGLTPNLKFSIYRDKIKDNVTLYQGKNSDSIKNELSNIYITKEGYKPLTERIKNEGETEWFSTFKINYTYDTEDNTLSWGSSGCSTHGDSGSWNGISSSLSEINNPFSQANNVLTKAYLGKPGIGDKESTLEKNAFNILGKTFNKNLVYEKLGDNYIQFFPYIKMKYNTVEDETNKEAYIVSTNESKVRNLSSVETGVYQSKNGYGIDISSEQWSTHRKTMDGLKENGVAQAFLNKGLLPGGAVIKLNTSNTNNNIPEVWVGLRTYEMSIPDDLKVTLSSTEGIKTTSEAKANAEQLVEDVRKNLSNYHVEKWIKEGITIDEGDMDSGASKVSGVSYKINNTVYKPVTRFGSNDLSTDSKYYLKENVNGADSSKLDVINIDEETNKLKDMEIHIYNISSDTDGKVTVKKDGVGIISTNIKKDKNASSLLSNEDVKRVNERVKFVENFIASLDFEEGKDRENKAWYYEAQDGIDVVEMTAAFHLGFGKDNAIRSEVADVKLTGKLENKGDILNFDSSKLNEKTRTVQYRMSAAPANASCEKAGYIGTFNGQEVRVDKMYTVMRSRLYYMGNNTVMDLN